MSSDTSIAELLTFAKKIGLKPQWLQSKNEGITHFDLTPGRHRLALRHGAVEVDGVEWIRRCEALRNADFNVDKLLEGLE